MFINLFNLQGLALINGTQFIAALGAEGKSLRTPY